MPSTRKGGGEAPPGNTMKPNKGKRQLVRWDQDLDTLLLLTIQSACNLTGVKVPWDKVAELMGPKFSEGAIVQHLSKVRLRRDAAGQRVPPPLRRSVTAASAATGSGSKGSSKSAKASSRKRKRSDDDIEEAYYDDLGAKEDYESDPEYIHDKKKYKASRSLFSNKKKSSRVDDGRELLCAGAPFLRHLGQDEYEGYKSDFEEESDDDELDEDYDSDYLANIKDEQGSPTPRPSRIVKLPVNLRKRDPNTMKSIRSLDTSTPPASSLSGKHNQSFENIDPAITNSNTGQMYGHQGVWYPVPMPISQPPENPYQAGQSQMYWGGAPTILNGQILQQPSFMWSQNAPRFATGHGGTSAVSGPPPQAWTTDPALTSAPSAETMDPSMWHIDHSALEQQDEHNEPQFAWDHKHETDDELE